MKSLNELAKIINDGAHEKGWWDKDHQNDGEKIALMHSELSEALEELRAGKDRTEVYYGHKHDALNNNEIAKPEGVPIELADCIIRILDYCGQWDIDIDMAFEEKMAYNCNRPYRHGNKEF
jgi:NTP pyrophosphatase (non-canonical NTP hydrolase)